MSSSNNDLFNYKSDVKYTNCISCQNEQLQIKNILLQKFNNEYIYQNFNIDNNSLQKLHIELINNKLYSQLNQTIQFYIYFIINQRSYTIIKQLLLKKYNSSYVDKYLKNNKNLIHNLKQDFNNDILYLQLDSTNKRQINNDISF